MEPQIKGFSRLPDLRVGSPPDNWVYVEITSANQSKAGLRLRSVLESVANIVGNIEEPFTLEIFLRREPTGQEIETIRANAARFSGRERQQASCRSKGYRRRRSSFFATASRVSL
jgi:hypothetical protein